MPVLYNSSTGAPETLADSDASKALASGTHEVPLVDENGQLGSAPQADVGQLLQKGYTTPSSAQLQKAVESSKNEQPLEQAKALAEGVAQSATLGLSTAYEKAFGQAFQNTPQAETEKNIQRRKETGANTVGQVVGMMTPGGATEMVAKGLSGAAEHAIAQEAPSIVNKIGTQAAKMAIDNATFAGSDEMAKMLMHDPEQSLDTALSNVGMAAAIGGALGGGASGVSELWKLGPGAKLENVLDAMKARSAGVSNPAETALNAMRASPIPHAPASSEQFYSKIQDVLNNKNPLYKANITPYTLKEYEGMKTFLAEDGKSGYAIKPDGELVSVFSLEKGRGPGLIDDAVLNNGAQKLDAFDINNKLPKLYGKYMDETSRLKFADEYAPADWDYDKIGRPDVVMMRLNPNKVQSARLATPELSPEIRAALGDDPRAHAAFQHLMESNTKSGTELQKSVADFQDSMARTAQAAVGKSTEDLEALHDISKADVGRNFQESLGKAIKEKVEPISAKYDAITDKFSSSVLGEADKADIASKITQHIQDAGLAKGPNESALKLSQKVLEQLPKQETVQDLRKYVQGLYTTAPFGSADYQTARAIRNVLNESIDGIIGKEAGAEFQATQAEYGKFKGILEDLNDRLHMGREGKAGATTFSKALADMAPEDVVNRLKLKDDTQLQALLEEHFPEAAQSAKKYELDQLLKSSLHKDGDKLDISKLTKKLQALQPEHRDYLLDKDTQSRLAAIHSLSAGLPAKMNNSGTAKTLDSLWKHVPAGIGGMIGMMTGHNPVIAALMGQVGSYLGKEVPDAAKLSMLKFMGSNSPTSAAGFAAATKFADNMLKGSKAVTNAAEMVFKGGTMAGTEGLSKQREKLQEHLDTAATDPTHLLKSAGDIGHYMPEHASMLTQSASRATQYLATLKPNDAKQSPLDAKPTISKAAQATYNRALDIANKPLIVMDALKHGTMTSKDVQHLAAMYPALTRQLQEKLGQEMMDAVSAGREIPYKVKLGLSIFMSQPLDSSMSQPAIAASQPMAVMPPQAAKPPSAAKMHGLQKLPNSYTTMEQDRAQRRTSSH